MSSPGFVILVVVVACLVPIAVLVAADVRWRMERRQRREWWRA